MLPSTGYFKSINCPFYESGSCDRPYCHFKHARKDDTANILASSAAETTQAAPKPNDVGATTSAVATPNPDVLQKLVTEAVKKVLADQEVTNTEKFSENIVTKVVEELKPTLSTGSLVSSSTAPETSLPSTIGKHTGVPSSISKCVYNPTPIAELKKRHIPIASYIPLRESKVAAKRKTSPERNKDWLSIIRGSGNNYSTNAEAYKPMAVGSSDTNSMPSYVPTARSSSPANSYDDSNSNEYFPKKSKEQYFPKVKKRREEYVPRRIKHPLKTVQQLEETIEDETVLDEFTKKFETVNAIFMEEKENDDAVNEESQEYANIESAFSDEECVDENVAALTKEVRQLEEEVSKIKYLEEKENTEIEENEKTEENVEPVIVKSSSSNSSHKKEHSSSNSSKTRSSETKKEKSKSDKSGDSRHKENKRDEEKSKSKSSKTKTSRDKHSSTKSKEHSSSSSKDRGKERDKDKEKEKEKDKDREKDKEKEKDKSKEKSKDAKDSRSKDSKESKDLKSKSKKDSRSEKQKESSRDSKKDKHKSDKHDKHRSKSSSSSSKTDKHKSHKNDDKHHSNHKSSSSNNKYSSSSKKSSKTKESSREKSDSDQEDRNFGTEINDMHFNFEDEENVTISDSDHDVEEECLKIFQEYEVSDHSKDISKKKSYKRHIEEVEDSEDIVNKKRVAHPSAASTSVRLPGPSQPKKDINPQRKMYERWRSLQTVAAAKSADKDAEYVPEEVKPISSRCEIEPHIQLAEPSSSSKNESQLNGNGRIRIAHVPYAMSLALAKKKVLETVSKPVEVKTTAQTTKSGSRVAHIPQAVPNLIRPEPTQVATQKFPVNVRQYYVNIMHDICVQIYTNGDDAAQRATREEFACHERCKALPVYKNSCMLAAHRLRKEVEQGLEGSTSTASASGMVSHEAVLAGKSKGSWSVIKTKKSVADLHGANLYCILSKWILTEQQLKDNGFPRPHPDGPKGRAKVYVTNTRNQSILSKVPNERFCCRCNQPYMVDRYGLATRKQNCIYHWGRKFTFRGESKYSCCQQEGSASGCCDAKSHVWEHVDYENLRGYVTTLPKDIPDEEQGVFALDCEMCYTTQGLELTRVTVINEDCHVVYETLVKPENPIIDYNTRFSGITEENMNDVSTTLLDVQATFLTMFSSKTILVGHSLESDFKALKLIHDTVVDTSIMFPHKHGYPQKRALKNLCSEYLRKIIQNDVSGHDSNEDAVACMELILWKVKEEAKLL